MSSVLGALLGFGLSSRAGRDLLADVVLGAALGSLIGTVAACEIFLAELIDA
jgi:hypothetical protein